MMKKSLNTLLILLCAAVLALGVSCSTFVQVRDHVPAAVNMSSMKKIAVTSTNVVNNYSNYSPNPYIRIQNAHIGAPDSQIQLYTAWQGSLPATLGIHTQSSLCQKLSETDYFTVAEPTVADALYTSGVILGSTKDQFIQAGIDAVLSSRLTVLTYDEYIFSKEFYHTDQATGNKVADGINYYLKTTMAILLEYNVIGVEQSKLVISKNYNRKIEKETLVATYKYAAGTEPARFTYKAYTAPSLLDDCRSAINDMLTGIVNDLAPRWVYSYEELLPNSAKVKEIDRGYELAQSANYSMAYDVFYDAWLRYGDVNSGYNAAILLYARGWLEDAVVLMQEVYTRTGSQRAYEKAQELKYKLQQAQIADAQVSGTTTGVNSSLNENEVWNIYVL